VQELVSSTGDTKSTIETPNTVNQTSNTPNANKAPILSKAEIMAAVYGSPLPSSPAAVPKKRPAPLKPVTEPKKQETTRPEPITVRAASIEPTAPISQKHKEQGEQSWKNSKKSAKRSLKDQARDTKGREKESKKPETEKSAESTQTVQPAASSPPWPMPGPPPPNFGIPMAAPQIPANMPPEWAQYFNQLSSYYSWLQSSYMQQQQQHAHFSPPQYPHAFPYMPFPPFAAQAPFGMPPFPGPYQMPFQPPAQQPAAATPPPKPTPEQPKPTSEQPKPPKQADTSPAAASTSSTRTKETRAPKSTEAEWRAKMRSATTVEEAQVVFTQRMEQPPTWRAFADLEFIGNYLKFFQPQDKVWPSYDPNYNPFMGREESFKKGLALMDFEVGRSVDVDLFGYVLKSASACLRSTYPHLLYLPNVVLQFGTSLLRTSSG